MIIESQDKRIEKIFDALIELAPALVRERKEQDAPAPERPTWSAFVQAIKNAQFEFPALKPYVLAQAILESGRGLSALFQHKNPFGMHYHSFLAPFAKGVEYQANDGKGVYAEFKSFDDAIAGYFAWFDNWQHYGDWRAAAKLGGAPFLQHIGCHYCPPGYTTKWIAEHSGKNYHQHICEALLPEALKMLGMDEPAPAPKLKPGVLDPGHSEKEPGARSNDDTAEEENLNRLQAEIIAERTKGCIAFETYDPPVDDLEAIGAKAKGKRLFISLHHNSYSGSGDPGVEAYVASNASAESKIIARKIVDRICQKTGATNRGIKVKDYTVIATASTFCTGAVMLIESYFLNPYDRQKAEQRSRLCAEAIAEVLCEEYS